MADYETVAKLEDIEPGELACVKVGETELALARVDGEVYAVQGHCLHLQGPLCEGRLARQAMIARVRFVGQALYALLEKPLHPLVDKATTDPDHSRNVGDRYASGDEQDNPTPASTPRRDGGGTLPRQERLPLGRCEADGEGGCASTSHTATFCAMW